MNNELVHVQRFSGLLSAWINNLARTGRARKQVVGVIIDASLVVVSLWLAFTLRHGVAFSDFGSTLHLFILLPTLSGFVFSGLGIYRWVIRSSNRRLFRQLVKGCIISAVSLIIIVYLFPPDRIMPRSLFAIYSMLLLIGTIGIRFLWQELFDTGSRGEPIAIYGAGVAGRQLVNALSIGNHNYRPVLFIDDSDSYRRATVAGLPVVPLDDPHIGKKLAELEIDRAVLAIPSLSAEEYQRKYRALEAMGLSVQTLPTVTELMSGQAKVNEIRDISIQDILGRSEVLPNAELLGKCVTGKSVLVTGGGGSIGSELCRQIARLAPKRLIVLEQSEENLYTISEEMHHLLPDGLTTSSASNDAANRYIPVLGSVTDASLVSQTIRSNAVDTVYHAAAYKHVPIIENQPAKGVECNVFGTLTVLEQSLAHRVEHFVLISTDKAVRPTNAMGASKRVAELVLQAKSLENPETKICMVRFGNVLGSSGSVVPKFKKQIEAGGPVTVTHPDVTRYFMTIPEASLLVLQAGSIARGGEVFVLDMGKPMRILDLAKTMVRLYGKRLSEETGDPSDIGIVFEGLRPGEKMYEELFITDSHRKTSIPKVFWANEHYLHWNELSGWLSRLRADCESGDQERIRRYLLDLAHGRQPGDLDHPEKRRAADTVVLPATERQRNPVEYNQLADSVTEAG